MTSDRQVVAILATFAYSLIMRAGGYPPGMKGNPFMALKQGHSYSFKTRVHPSSHYIMHLNGTREYVGMVITKPISAKAMRKGKTTTP